MRWWKTVTSTRAKGMHARQGTRRTQRRRNDMEFKRRRELKRTKIEIIPMIDTMFFLLVFFMLSSLALARLNGFPVNLPRASTAPKQPPTELTITIDKNQRIFVNKMAVTAADLGTALVQKAGGPSADLSNATVIIN